MTLDERKEYVRSLVADFQRAIADRSQDVAVWMSLARRYQLIGANMSVAYCVRRAQECRPVMRVVTDLGMPGMSLALTLVPVAVETEAG